METTSSEPIVSNDESVVRRDTNIDFPGSANNNNSPFNTFLNKFRIDGLVSNFSRGRTLEDGRKTDVINLGNGAIKLEYDYPIVIGGKRMGWTRVDLIFSEVTGDCISFNFKDVFDFDAATPEGAAMKIEYCTRRRPDWKQILGEFEEAFKTPIDIDF